MLFWKRLKYTATVIFFSLGIYWFLFNLISGWWAWWLSSTALVCSVVGIGFLLWENIDSNDLTEE